VKVLHVLGFFAVVFALAMLALADREDNFRVPYQIDDEDNSHFCLWLLLGMGIALMAL
jgi:nitrous oxide reductase accessory protein NosL